MQPKKKQTLRQARGKKPTVLIIEDEQFLCRLLTKKFESSGFVVREALSGETGLNMVGDDGLPDVILLDILLPGIDGFEVLRRLKSNTNSQGIPVVMISNLGETRDMDKSKQLGEADYIIKAQSSPQEIVDKAWEFIPA
jgi:PleD family two-component response regulator